MKVQERSPAYEVLAQFASADEWTFVPLKDLGTWSGGGTPSKSKLDYWEGGTIPWVSPKDMKTDHIVDSEDHITQAAVEESTAKLISAGSVLIVTRSGILSHTLPVALTTVPVTVNQDLKALTPRENVLPEYVAWALRCFAREILNTCSKQGTTVSSIETAALHHFEIPIAPLDQQKRIVAEIEKQFSRLDEAIANLKRVKANLKRYKAAVLKAAVEGRLVETEAERARREGRSYETGAQLLQRILETRHSQWKGKGKYKEPASPDTADLPELPEGWVWASVDQLVVHLTDGDHQAPPQTKQGIPFLVIGNVRSGEIDFSDSRFVGEAYYKSLDPSRQPKLGDLLYTLVGSYGIPVRVTTAKPFCIQRHMAILRPHEHSPMSYLTVAMESGNVFKQATAVATGTAQLTVPLAGLRRIAIPLPPISEQKRIVAEVDHRLSLLRKTEAQVDANLQRAERLRHSILMVAFSGNFSKHIHSPVVLG